MNACSGVSIGIPVGSVVIGTSVMNDGRVAVGASTAGGSVAYSGKARSHPAFDDVPDDAPQANSGAKHVADLHAGDSSEGEEKQAVAEAGDKVNDQQDSGEE